MSSSRPGDSSRYMGCEGTRLYVTEMRKEQGRELLLNEYIPSLHLKSVYTFISRKSIAISYGVVMRRPLVRRLTYKIRYKLQSKLGPVNMPSQNTKLPNVWRSFNHLVRLNLTSLTVKVLENCTVISCTCV